MLCYLRVVNIRKLNKFIMILSRHGTVVILLLLQKMKANNSSVCFIRSIRKRKSKISRGKTISKGKCKIVQKRKSER